VKRQKDERSLAYLCATSYGRGFSLSKIGMKELLLTSFQITRISGKYSEMKCLLQRKYQWLPKGTSHLLGSTFYHIRDFQMFFVFLACIPDRMLFFCS